MLKILKRIFKTFINDSKSEFGHVLWNISNFEIWAQLFLDKKFVIDDNYLINDR